MAYLFCKGINEWTTDSIKSYKILYLNRKIIFTSKIFSLFNIFYQLTTKMVYEQILLIIGLYSIQVFQRQKNRIKS